MRATLIDGKATAHDLTLYLTGVAARLKEKHGLVPGVDVILVGDDPASAIYVRGKARAAERIGINGRVHNLPTEITFERLAGLIDDLNADKNVHGILIQLPLPRHLDANALIERVDSNKDVDGIHPVSQGRLMRQVPGFVSCTPLGCSILLKKYLLDITGKTAVVVGRSSIVGRPMAQLLLNEDCTVTIAHSRTRDLPALCRSADILVAAVGRAEMIQGDWIKPGAVVIDVGINRIDVGADKPKLVGDVAFDEAVEVAGFITPVPGGVGPMTIACLMANTVEAAAKTVDPFAASPVIDFMKG
ncbi:MAG: bifunctional methylenetetrahydrofolate dehydrogenase/methenyltetrahydrofolate cyclohydrolase FolD [Pseudomonadota bacterium]|nr:bifunctional methylenetetrahydrofolate dehydrogenase/methenyltetrahydrofolate cyclohydrolase FolD [Pseudomonadota bacterium]